MNRMKKNWLQHLPTKAIPATSIRIHLSLLFLPIRSLFYIGGYTEGWGLYSELYAYDFLGYSTETASALRALSSLNYAICSVLDLEVHTSGWTEEDCSNYLQNFGITDAEPGSFSLPYHPRRTCQLS